MQPCQSAHHRSRACNLVLSIPERSSDCVAVTVKGINTRHFSLLVRPPSSQQLNKQRLFLPLRKRTLLVRIPLPVFHNTTQSAFFDMCIFDMLSTSEPSTKPVMIQYEIRICEKEEYIQSDASSCKVSVTSLSGFSLSYLEANPVFFPLCNSLPPKRSPALLSTKPRPHYGYHFVAPQEEQLLQPLLLSQAQEGFSHLAAPAELPRDRDCRGVGQGRHRCQRSQAGTSTQVHSRGAGGGYERPVRQGGHLGLLFSTPPTRVRFVSDPSHCRNHVHIPVRSWL